MKETEKPTSMVAQNSQMVTFSPVAMFLDKNYMDAAQRSCRALASSDLVPQQYQIAKQGEAKAIANCLIALNKASVLGIDPLTVMQNMYIVHGNPSWSSSFLISCINSCGRYRSLRYRWEQDGEVTVSGKKIPNTTCVAYTFELDDKEMKYPLESAVISIRMAVDEGWFTKSGSKWQTMPQQMLMYRAAAFWARVYAPEISMGMRTVEENLDIVDADYEEIPTTQEAAPETDKTSTSLMLKLSRVAASKKVAIGGEAPAAEQDIPSLSNEPEALPTDMQRKMNIQ